MGYLRRRLLRRALGIRRVPGRQLYPLTPYGARRLARRQLRRGLRRLLSNGKRTGK